MAPNPIMQEIEVNHIVKESVVVCAMPFNKACFQQAEEKLEDSPSPDPGDGSVRSVPSTGVDSEEVDPVRVSTSARYSYELDRLVNTKRVYLHHTQKLKRLCRYLRYCL